MAGKNEGTTAVASNLTRDEAHDRGRLVDVRSYRVDLDPDGEVRGYERLRRFTRATTDES